METFGMPIEQELFVLVNLIIIESILAVGSSMILFGTFSFVEKSLRTKSLGVFLGLYVLVTVVVLLFASWLAYAWWLNLFLGLGMLYFAQALFRKKELNFSMPIFAVAGVLFFIPTLKDQTFTAIALTSSMPLIYISMLIAPLVMAVFVIVYFWLLDKFPSVVFVGASVLLLKGFVLIASFVLNFFPDSGAFDYLYSESFDVLVSLLIIASIVVCIAIEYIRKQRAVV